jgi:succinate dehydrogenase / fumarate reductase, membrane anchor subunit
MPLDQKTIADPKTRYGSRAAGTLAFISQRISGGLLAVFTIFFIWIVVRLAHADVQGMGDLLSNPIVAVVTGLMIIVTAIHMQAGMREIIEDYVHEPKLNRLSLLLNTLFCLLVALVTLGALIKLVVRG